MISNIVSMLEELFPSIYKDEGIILPNWDNPEAPWRILADGEGGLIEQLTKLTESSSEVYIHPTAKIGDFVKIEGPSFIGPNATIRHGAYIRKGSWICDRALVGHSSEVKNSILLSGSKVPHVNYVGDSIIGLGANLGAGVKLSKVRNDRREVLLSI